VRQEESQMSDLYENAKWDYGNLHDLLVACVGYNFGPNPESNIQQIRQDRARLGHKIIRDLGLNNKLDVADLGSGCGFVDRPIAPVVKSLVCIDISPTFLAYCQEELREFQNVSCCLAEFGKFTDVKDASLDVLYSTAVFIHFNYYDFVINLHEVARILRLDGIAMIQILDADELDITENRAFSEHYKNYRLSRTTHVFNVVHPFSLTALKKLAPQLGFSIERVNYLQHEFIKKHAVTTVFLRKIGYDPDSDEAYKTLRKMAIEVIANPQH
jgi:ubiquinone/menaquinone biosynthesis C-methylase UbiE